jgi:pyridoxamine 5'-phosphate oxidase
LPEAAKETSGQMMEEKITDFSQIREPMSLFRSWLDEAERSEIADANAMTLATADENGLPDARMVLLKGLDERGFVFFTNYESAKGGQLLAHPLAALCFHWKSLSRQVRVRGPVEQVSTIEADAYYATRPRGSRIGAWASAQSRPLESREELEKAVQRFEQEFAGLDPARPRYWSGFRVLPIQIEFWQNRLYRLHDRIVFRRPSPEDGTWTRTRLYP